MKDYIKSTDKLPEENITVWVRICERRARKMYRIGDRFFYCNKMLFNNGNFTSIGESVLWRYCDKLKALREN